MNTFDQFVTGLSILHSYDKNLKIFANNFQVRVCSPFLPSNNFQNHICPKDMLTLKELGWHWTQVIEEYKQGFTFWLRSPKANNGISVPSEYYEI